MTLPSRLASTSQAEGATLASVAEAHGKSREELKAFLTKQLQTRLDEAVSAARITREQADSKLSKYTSNLDAIIDGTAPSGFPGGGHGFSGDGPFRMPPAGVPPESDSSSSS
jgi:hypothetical protein